MPYRTVPFPRASAELRQVIGAHVPAGEKTTLARFCGDRPRFGLELLLGYAEALSPHAEAAFGEPATMLLAASTIRHHGAERAELAPWHVDRAAFFREVDRGLIFWLTFDDAGDTVPSIEFDYGGRRVIPKVKAGHVLVFGPDVPHRTQPIYGERVSVEFRCAPVAGRRGSWLDLVQATVESTPTGRELVMSRHQQTINRFPVQAAPQRAKPDRPAPPVDGEPSAVG